MEIDKILTIIIQAGSFMAAFAGITAGIIMSQVRKKFGSGILASGFKMISIGVLFIAAGIIIDAINSYMQLSNNIFLATVVIIKELLFVIGTYIIVVGSKNTGDKLESLTK